MGVVLFIFAGFEAWLLFNSFKWEVFIQNHKIEACPTPKAKKWGTNLFIIAIYWSPLFTRIHAEACYYSIATKWGIPLFKYTYWGMPLFQYTKWGMPLFKMRHATIQIHLLRHATIQIHQMRHAHYSKLFQMRHSFKKLLVFASATCPRPEVPWRVTAEAT